jgi:DNA-directed RNA polymerase subunit RPC12/RpoP
MNRSGPVGLVTLVCLTCGNEHSYDESVPSQLKCEKCGGTVFRQFATPTEPDEASIAALEAQARSIALDDVSPQTARDDVHDLDAR